MNMTAGLSNLKLALDGDTNMMVGWDFSKDGFLGVDSSKWIRWISQKNPARPDRDFITI